MGDHVRHAIIFYGKGRMPAKGFTIPRNEIAQFCKRWNVFQFAVIGSALRADFHPDSDVDVLVAFQAGTQWGLLDHLRMEQELQNLLGRRVDLISRAAVLHSQNQLLRDEILNTAQAVYTAGDPGHASG